MGQAKVKTIVPTSTNNIPKLLDLYPLYKIDGYIVPSTDEFNNEYVPVHLKRLEWLTGFSGSNGLAIVLKHKTALLTDGRYLTQARLEVDKDVDVIDIAEHSPFHWLAKYSLDDGLTVGYNPGLYTQNRVKKYQKVLEECGVKLVPIYDDLIDMVWLNKPKLKQSKVIDLDITLTGRDRTEKVQHLLERIPKQADYLLLTSPDSICWLLNIRASDVPYTPLLLSYLLISKQGQLTLYVYQQHKLLSLAEVKIDTIDRWWKCYADLLKEGKSIAMDRDTVPALCYHNPYTHQIIDLPDPCIIAKSVKNDVELEGFRTCHIEDGIAFCKFLHFLEQSVVSGIDEIEASEHLLRFRKERKYFQGSSYHDISAYGSNGAIVHYNAKPNSRKIIGTDNLYLLDSGAHYLNGTTDVTRTLCFGQATEEQKYRFTMVLKGHIQLAQAKFPVGTTGLQLDVLARYHLWQSYLDYRHGTGHGIGHFLCVHEGPQRITNNILANVPLQPGMVVSNEPGFYKDGQYGIRIENVMIVRYSNQPDAPSSIRFLEFEVITMVPIALNLVLFELLTAQEKKWLYSYHQRVYDLIAQHLDGPERLWLKNQTQGASYQ
ncbi:aminopeptidase P family protein [Rickettsiales endosymbiont of Peranema trichophorum]|uniref:aminopeptidase P family protein n=1 Tax=Rickettsiales endosymbiont of Peranema trichophorum TaxID=2486577 RepID=UPI001023F18C|nr:aminopeptidase P family protein [Rickettsiales endosymbiont of Peranema trichophorum]RZI47601.1 aminopeptidase P family protein [Rickettsiales endosymbiont of Peranema trichophorum]